MGLQLLHYWTVWKTVIIGSCWYTKYEQVPLRDKRRSWWRKAKLLHILHQYTQMLLSNYPFTVTDVNISYVYIFCDFLHTLYLKKGLSWSWSYRSWIYNYLCSEVYSIQHFVIKFIGDLRQVSVFLRVIWFHPPIKLTARNYMKYCWKWR